jgi:hypothetical protein
MRDDLADTGQIPSKAATASNSPDVIVWGTDPAPDPAQFFSTNYRTTWYRNAAFGQQNFLYCRAKNLFPGSQTGRVYLRYANAGLFSDIASWRDNIIGTSIAGQDFINLSAQRNEIVVGDSAFVWTPPQPPPGAHYCLVAQLVTEENPNPLPLRFASSEEYVKWVVDNPAVAWRNVQVVNAGTPPQYQENFFIENLERGEAEFLLSATAFNLPAGSSLSIVCGAIGPEPPINRSTNTSGGTRPAQVAQSSFLPPSFAGWITATVKLPDGQKWTGNMEVLVEAYLLSSTGDSEYMLSLAEPLSSILVDPSSVADPQRTAVRLGRYTIQTMTERTLP